MSTPDSKLSAAERAALADLEAAAAAEDPHLAARLRGTTGTRARAVLAIVASRTRRQWAVTVGLGWWGLPVAVAGMALMVVGLAFSYALAVLGAVGAAVGLRILAQLVQERLRRSGPAR